MTPKDTSKLEPIKRKVFAHGKEVEIEVDPLLEILYKLRPKIGNEYGYERVNAVKQAHQAITNLLDQEVVKASILELSAVDIVAPKGSLTHDYIEHRIKELNKGE